MKNGKFTLEEQEYLVGLDAVEAVTPQCIYYTHTFKRYFIQAYKQGLSPKDIFEQAGLSPALIGYRRIERACARWKVADQKVALLQLLAVACTLINGHAMQ